MKLKTKVEQLQRAAPKRSRYGQLYRDSAQLKKRHSKATLFTLFLSEDNTHLLRPHVFKKSEPMTAAGWHEWFSDHLKEIQEKFVLPGLGIRTGKAWGVQKIIGWIGGDVKHQFDDSALSTRRNKTKP